MVNNVAKKAEPSESLPWQPGVKLLVCLGSLAACLLKKACRLLVNLLCRLLSELSLLVVEVIQNSLSIRIE